MATPTFPGVYIREIPSGVRTITGVATSITAFVGRAPRGPTDDPVTINSFADYERRFGGLHLDSTMSYAVRDFYLNGGSQAIIIRLHSNAVAAHITLPAHTNDDLMLEASSVGSWGNNLKALVNHNTINPADQNLFNLTVFEEDPNTHQVLNSEKFVNLSVDPTSPRFVAGMLEASSLLVRVRKDASGDYEVSSVRPEETVNPALSPPEELPAPVSATGGTDGGAITDDSFIGTGKEGNKQGLFALEKADMFNLLCIPPYANAGGSAPAAGTQPTDANKSLIAQAVAYASKRRAMLIIDSPSMWTNKSIAKAQFSDGTFPDVTGPVSRNAAIFFPRLKQVNPKRENQIEEFVPCGAVAGIFSRTDAQRGVWKAPAGLDAAIIGTQQLSVHLTDEENGELNPLGINCLRAFPVAGKVVWGSRTLDGADQNGSEWKYIPVRRTALFIEESLYRGTKWVVFEPNDEPLWAQIRLNIGAFMQDLFRRGAFQGKTPREAYLVKCDKETTTQNDINRGIVNILVGFAPLKPAEFVIISIQQLAGQIQT